MFVGTSRAGFLFVNVSESRTGCTQRNSTDLTCLNWTHCLRGEKALRASHSEHIQAQRETPNYLYLPFSGSHTKFQSSTLTCSRVIVHELTKTYRNRDPNGPRKIKIVENEEDPLLSNASLIEMEKARDKQKDKGELNTLRKRPVSNTFLISLEIGTIDYFLLKSRESQKVCSGTVITNNATKVECILKEIKVWSGRPKRLIATLLFWSEHGWRGVEWWWRG
ncbi:hypothetical protein J6590_041563 [Homalodisca vitripennis]|nr:hypothetical protein J6590_041563 [Homalodisca vitripennis]